MAVVAACFTMDRRSFIKAGMSFAAGASILRGGVFANTAVLKCAPRLTQLDDEQSRALRDELLTMANFERKVEGLRPLQLDDFASQIATQHAQDMADGLFLSHWGRDGRKPYQRYSFAGGTEATEENDGAIDHSDAFVTSEEFVRDVLDAHLSMFVEMPPNDGHRKTILGPQHTHVGFGMAGKYGHIRLSEIYVARYIAVDGYAPLHAPRSKFRFGGRLLQRGLTIRSIDVFYEELPQEPSLAWLRVARPYSLPEERTTLYPKLPPDHIYEDGSRGSIEVLKNGFFKVHVPLGNRPGIYTVVTWVQSPEFAKPFPATQVCVRVE